MDNSSRIHLFLYLLNQDCQAFGSKCTLIRSRQPSGCTRSPRGVGFVSSSRHKGSKCQRACQSVIKYWALFCCLHCTFQRQYLESWAPSKKLGISRNRLCDAPRFLEDASYDKGNDGWLTTLLPPLKLFLPICKNATLNMIFSFTEIF